ncbi:MAG: hypothetical protein GY759_07400, partial [Chloroflexi bacterium]|nr:hypothetical protein [Chloroflexota bacterium]
MRSRIYLNGEWDFMPDYENRTAEQVLQDCRWDDQKLRVPSSWRYMIDPEADYQPYDMFAYPRAWNEAQSGILGRSFTVDPNANERVYLVLEGVLQSSVVFVNGTKVLETQEGFLPLEIDITDHVKTGADNDLKVWCGPFDSIEIETGRKDLAPNGSWFAKLARGIWQDVYLEYRPALFVENVFVRTSTRRQTIVVDVGVCNSAEISEGWVKLTILDDAKIVKELVSDAVSFASGDITSLALTDTWADAVYWSPEHPHLYTLQTEIVVDDRITDSMNTRFGFREVWIDGHKLYLNGTRVNLREDAWHYQGFVQQTRQYALNWYQVCKETGINCVRPHAMPYPSFYLDVADEVGMLIVDESAIYGSSKSNPADHPSFIENCHQHLRALIKRDRNHPSIIMWSMQNEMRWVDGRDGYKAAMKQLTQTIKNLDVTRPISYDGDNRLVDPGDLEVISMHYNIDGTVQSWQKDIPLTFGEHGKWHYVCPQACVDMAGPDAFYSYDRCQTAMGEHERLFIEYARKEEVTGLCPFNMSNYMVKTMPEKDIALSWDDLSAPGVKPNVIPAHTLTINNGFVDEPPFRPNPSWDPVRQAFKPVTIFADEYNSAFFGEIDLRRTFSMYNDTEKPVEAKMLYRLATEDGMILSVGEESFSQAPGERVSRQVVFALPAVAEMQRLNLQLYLYHDAILVHSLTQVFRVYPQAIKTASLDNRGKRIAYVGDSETYNILAGFLPDVTWLNEPESEPLEGVDVLVVGRHFDGSFADWQARLEVFVSKGGCLLLLEQGGYVPGEVSLSGKKFYSAYMTDPEHKLFSGLSNEDLCFWGPDNIHDSDRSFLIQNAFHKPVQGDLNILLECGEGDFGYGGMLWAAILEYKIGRGLALLNQVDLCANFKSVPQAALLLRNLLTCCIEYERQSTSKVGLLTPSESGDEKFFQGIGLRYELVVGSFADYSLIILNTDALDKRTAAELYKYVAKGGRALVLAAEPQHKGLLQAVVGEDIAITGAELYQVVPNQHPLMKGISPHDLFHIERASYAQLTQENTVVCENAIEIRGGEWLWKNV